ncbi:MAG: urease accessory UreF family protein, partial [Chloroflexota bacterium]
MDLSIEQLITLQQLTDSMFPSGSFVHSEGLETYVQSGIIASPEELEALLRIRLLQGLALSDWVATQAAMDFYVQEDLASLLQLDEKLSAMKIAMESREASMRSGRQTLRTVLAFLKGAFLHDYQRAVKNQSAQGHQALVFGVICAAMQIEKRPALAAYGYSFVSGQVSAAIKLMRMGQTQAQQLLWYLQPTIDEA